MSIRTFDTMIGKTFKSIRGDKSDSEMVFIATDDSTFTFDHYQDCCESVWIEDVVGDLEDLIGSPLVLAEEIDSSDAPAVRSADKYQWTFYRFGTKKGTVTVRWLGESNGYYGMGVSYSEKLASEPSPSSSPTRP